MFSSKLLFRAVIVISLTVLSFPTFAADEDRFLDFYELKTNERGYVLKVRFNEAVSYVNHHTENSNKTIKINVRPLLIRFLPLSSLHINEIINPKKGNDAAVNSIRLENIEHSSDSDTRNNQLVLTLDFKIPVTFNITQDAGSKSISIYIDQVGQSKKFKQKLLATDDEISNKFYVINLLSSRKPIKIKNIPKDEFYKKYDVYLSETVSNEKTWSRLRLGYFSTKEKADLALIKAKKSYPKAWINLVSKENLAKAKKWLALDTLAAAKEEDSKPKTRTKAKQKKTKSKTALSDKKFIAPSKSKNKKVQFLMEKGRNAMIDTKYREAIRYYKKSYQLAKGDEKKLALEYLGLARERNGQIAHAKAVYRKFLKEYPTGEDAERVNQRLETILTARLAPKKKRAPKKRKTRATEWETFGTLFQFYRYQADDSDVNGSSTVDNSLSTNLSTSIRRRSEDYDMRFQFDGSHRYDELKESDKSDQRLSKLYADITSTKSKLHTRIGRQTSHNYGILGRFDGAIVDYPLSNKYKATMSYGYPVRSSKVNSIDTSTNFYGLGLDVNDIISKWDATFYAIKQTRNGVSDREAIGTEARTVSSNHSVFALLDYDTSYSELNTATIISNWLFGTKNVSTLNLVLDYRQAPTLTTSNALIGSTTASFEELIASTTEAEYRADAKDNTAAYKTITLSGSTPLSDKYQLNADLTLSTLSSTPVASGTGTESSYSLQFIGNNLLTENDVSVIGVRISNRSTADTTTYDLNSRIVLNKEWKVRPRLRYETQTQTTGTNRTILKPSVRFDYRLKRNFRIELDTGYDFKKIKGTNNSNDTSFYINLGYIYDF